MLDGRARGGGRVVLALVAASLLSGVAPSRRLVGAVWAQPVLQQHAPFFLLNGEGGVINPMTGENAKEPYSPAMTCGACHEYNIITRGYHFQQGARLLSDTFNPERPYVLSDGMFGNFCPPSFRQLAKKQNSHPDEMDMTVWEWVTSAPPGQPTCASCHPGGGPLEYDRDALRYDWTLAETPSLAQSLDGDYRGSTWHESGVLEADCLICHLPGYDWNARVAQLKNWNLKWAATAGSGLGAVKGRLFDPDAGERTGESPAVVYNKRLFNDDGQAVLMMNYRVSDTNCLQCHGPAEMKKRGFSWNDPINPDVHNQQGIQCVDCHLAGLDHNFAKGPRTAKQTIRGSTLGTHRCADCHGEDFPTDLEPPASHRDFLHLDFTMRSCIDCHTTGYLGASIPTHVDIPPSHLQLIACETCHIPMKHRTAGEFFDTTVGDLHWDVVGDREKWGQPAEWYPSYRVYDGQVHPVNPIFALWWGNRDADGIVYPLFKRELEAGRALYESAIKDDNGDGFAESNTREEIEAGLRAFEQVLAGNARFRQVHPVYVKGDKAWEFGEGGVLVGHWEEECEQMAFAINHNVAPSHEALGAGGCVDCHSNKGAFFKRTYVVDPFDEQGREIRAPVRRTMVGISDLSYTLFSVHGGLVRPWMGALLFVVFFATALHFTRYGPHAFGGRPLMPRVDDHERAERFNWLERFVHLTAIFTFFYLAFTGLAFAYNGGRWMHLIFASTITPRVWHGWVGLVFGAGVIAMLILWWRDAVLIPSDREWLRELGGYLGSHEPVLAARFNAGQKVYFWTVVLGGMTLLGTGTVLLFRDRLPLEVVVVSVMVHDLAALFGVAGVLSHIYLSTAANPGTIQAVFAGWVTRGWARLHHPIWYEKITGRPALDEPAAGDPSRRGADAAGDAPRGSAE